MARQKAQMRKEKEEIRKMELERQAAGAKEGGLGSSGVTIRSTGTGEVEVQAPQGFFSAYEFLAGTGKLPERKFSPIFRVPPFWSMLDLNVYIQQQPVPPEKLKDRAAMYEQLAKALSFVSHVCAETEKAVHDLWKEVANGLEKNQTGK